MRVIVGAVGDVDAEEARGGRIQVGNVVGVMAIEWRIQIPDVAYVDSVRTRQGNVEVVVLEVEGAVSMMKVGLQVAGHVIIVGSTV